MRKKIMILLIVFILLFSSYAFAYTYNRTGGTPLWNSGQATYITQDTTLDSKYNAEAIGLKNRRVSYFNSKLKKFSEAPTGKAVISALGGSEINYYYETLPNGSFYDVWYTLEFIGTKSLQDYDEDLSFSIVYTNALLYNGTSYDVELKVKNITNTANLTENNTQKVGFLVKRYSKDNKEEITFAPSIYAGENKANKVNVDVEYRIGKVSHDGSTNTDYLGLATDGVSGLFELRDIDLNQGIAVHDFVANPDTTYVTHKNDDVHYQDIKSADNTTEGAYFYSNTDQNMIYNANVYLLMENKNKIPMTFTFENKRAASPFVFVNNVIEKSYTVDFDTDGGTPQPDSQNVRAKNMAIKPETDPTKKGYTFKEWQKDGTAYDFSSQVTEDIKLKAKWEPIQYNITYTLNGGVAPSPDNSKTYTIEDEVIFKSPTRQGYTFEGWYENSSFTGNPITSIPVGSTGDKQLYAKWTKVEPEVTDAKYTVEYYLENSNGTYDKVDIEEKVGTIGETVTATSKTYTGYKENVTYEGRVPSGIVKKDESLILKLYYDREEYKVTFDPQGGNEAKEGDLDTQTVKYKDKATEPTNPLKENYAFKYWYYEDENGKEVQYSFDNPVVEDIELKAKWEKEEEKIEEGNGTKPSTQTNTGVKTDPTIAKKVLPNTGVVGIIATIVIGIVMAAFFGIRFLILKNRMK